jgi:hypothetical protein
MDFRQIGPEHFEAAHAIVVEVTDWLNGKGIKQWSRPVPEDIYRERHDRGENHGLFVEGRLAVVMSLSQAVPDRWPGFAPPEPFRWLGTMAVSRANDTAGHGPNALAAAEDYLRTRGIAAVYLDCVRGNGFLPRFYSENGYEELEAREMRPGFFMHLFRKGL